MKVWAGISQVLGKDRDTLGFAPSYIKGEQTFGLSELVHELDTGLSTLAIAGHRRAR